ncbi:MAG: DUF1697 domain-containing protein [Syntrophomonadaceae bacterium]|nr:DUF1697 domain-containing protein [Syntrophomonadaceae bacterium]
MEKYIALLRGINVGGKNKISMPELKMAFEENGFADVKTYINSGNVIFSGDIDSEIKLKKACENLIMAEFQLSIPVAIISAKDLSAALRNAPDWWGTDGETKHNAIFVLYPSTPETVIEQVGEFKPEYEQIDYYGQVIFWSAPIKTFSKTRWLRIVGTAVYDNVTIRNANTTKKLLQLTQ